MLGLSLSCVQLPPPTSSFFPVGFGSPVPAECSFSGEPTGPLLLRPLRCLCCPRGAAVESWLLLVAPLSVLVRAARAAAVAALPVVFLLENWRIKWQQRVMGQAESTAAANNESPRDNSQPSSMESPKDNSSLESLIAEAVAFGDDGDESLDEKAKKALECPCIAHLRSGPCGSDFSEAFLCFIKSTAEEKGSDCVHPFVMLQSCIKAHPDAFSKDVLEGEEVEKEANSSPEPIINSPRLSMEFQDVKAKL